MRLVMRLSRTMTTKVTFQGIHDDGVLIVPDSPEWYQWLESAKSFRFEVNHETWIDERVPKIEALTFSGVRVSGYWQAHKKVDGILRREHLGKSPDYAKLKEVAILICSDAYWHQKRRSVKSRSTESHKNHETELHPPSQPVEEIAKLKASIAELEKQEEQLLNLQTENMRLQDENAKLREEFKAQPEKLIAEYETDYGSIKGTLPKPPKEVTRNWVEFWRYKAWLKTREF